MKTWMVVFSLIFIGCCTSTESSQVPQTTDSRCGVVRGRVVDQKGVPVSGVRVYSMIMDRPPRARSADRGTGTDENGAFSLSCVEPGTNGIYVNKEADYYADTMLTPFFTKPSLAPTLHITGGQAINGVEIHLGPRAGKLNGQVVDAATSRIIEGAVLSICRSGRNPDCRQFNARNSFQGFSTLFPPIALTVKASAPGYEDSNVMIVQMKSATTKTLMILLKRK